MEWTEVDTFEWSWTNKLISDSADLFAELAPAILLLFLVIDCLRLLIHSEQPAYARSKIVPERPEAERVIFALCSPTNSYHFVLTD